MRIFTCVSPLLFDGIRNCAEQCKQARIAPHQTVPYRTGCNSSSVNTVLESITNRAVQFGSVRFDSVRRGTYISHFTLSAIIKNY